MLSHFRTYYWARRPVIWTLALYCTTILILKRQGFLDRVAPSDVSHDLGFVEITGVLSDLPDPNRRGCVYIIEAETVRPLEDSARDLHACSGRALIQLNGPPRSDGEPGDRVRVRGRLQTPAGARVPGSFDYADYLSNKKIHAVMYTGQFSFENLGPSDQYVWLRRGWRWRERIVAIFNQHMHPTAAIVLAGLTVGLRPRLFPEIRRIFIESGTMHILVASGTNIAFVVSICFFLLRLARVPRRPALVVSLPLVWFYTLLAGFDPPIVRAATMTTIGVVAYAAGREDRPYQPLAGAAWFLLLQDPRTLFDVGFVMSFLSVFGLIYFLSHFEPALARLPKALLWPARLMAATLTAQLWLAPVTAMVFKQFFPLGILANMIMVPMAAAGLTVGFVLAVAHALSTLSHSHSMVFICGWLAQLYSISLIKVALFFSGHSWARCWIKTPPWTTVACFYTTLLSLVWVKELKAARWVCGTAIIVGGLGLWVHQRQQQVSHLQLTWIDTGRRLACLIETPQQDRILIYNESADTEVVDRVLMPYFSERRIDHLDAVVISRPGAAPDSSVADLFEEIKIDRAYLCSNVDGFDPAMWIKTTEGLQIKFLNPNETVCWHTLSLTPLDGSHGEKSESPLLLQWGDCRILLGDWLSLKTQKWLTENVATLWMLQAHFADKARWDENFIERFHPEILVESGRPSSRFPLRAPWPSSIHAPQNEGYWTIKR